MLLLAHAAFPGQFEVATVDHGIREEASDECAFVAQVCEERGVPCVTLSVEVAAGNLQAQARAARYQTLREWANARGLAALCTAHHADDQAETLIMRLNRGSGVSGLAGARADYLSEDDTLRVVRPLLTFRRAELADVVAASGLNAVQDPSNDDTRFDRVRIRKALAEADWLDPIAIAQSAQHLADADEALNYEVGRYWDQHVERDGQTIRMRLHPMREMRLRLITRSIRELGGDPRGGDVARLDEMFADKSKGNVAGVMVELHRNEEGSFLHFSPEPTRRT